MLAGILPVLAVQLRQLSVDGLPGSGRGQGRRRSLLSGLLPSRLDPGKQFGDGQSQQLAVPPELLQCSGQLSAETQVRGPRAGRRCQARQHHQCSWVLGSAA